jgi:FdhE protein
MASARLLTPEEIALRAGAEPAHLRLPEPATLFAEREMRLRQLAAGHAMRDYLLFAAELARAQHEQAQARVPLNVPPASAFEAAAMALQPPLPAEHWARDPVWRADLRALLQRLQSRLDGPAREVARQLLGAGDEAIEDQATRLLSGTMQGLDLGHAPLIAAGLQLHWSRLIAESARAHAGLRSDAFGRIEDPAVCPCCGSRPTASVLRIGGEASGQRYLHCALCSAQWHLVRIRCARCGNTKGIDYRQLEAADAPPDEAPGARAVRAECCAACGHYLKLVAMDQDPQVEPVADDLASIALDLLVSDTGLVRHGVNLLLLFGDPEPS